MLESSGVVVIVPR